MTELENAATYRPQLKSEREAALEDSIKRALHELGFAVGATSPSVFYAVRNAQLILERAINED